MRESFGGAFMIKLVLIFIIIYVAFMAGAVNYAKVFRVKNRILDILEQNQYTGSNDSVTLGKVENELRDFNYKIPEADRTKLENLCMENAGTNRFEFTERGACIIEIGDGTSRYYRVTVHIVFDLPFISHLTLPISGDTESMGDWREIE